ncbi:hypothetical protein BC940DRAFT_311543 [Gongronella butleri]|nr:hypothetical protein BC940DRAFT_311543 [Gongronella butleri]
MIHYFLFYVECISTSEKLNSPGRLPMRLTSQDCWCTAACFHFSIHLLTSLNDCKLISMGFCLSLTLLYKLVGHAPILMNRFFLFHGDTRNRSHPHANAAADAFFFF